MVTAMERQVHEASVIQAAQLLGVSASTVRRWLGSGKLDGHRVAEGRGTPWRVRLPPELPAVASALHALMGRQSLARVSAVERRLAETQRALDELRARLDEQDALARASRAAPAATSAPPGRAIVSWLAAPRAVAVLVGEVIEADAADGVIGGTAPERGGERERAPLELATVREARVGRASSREAVSHWPPPTVTSIVLGRAEARYELPPGGEGIGWLRARQRRWPRRA